MNKCIVCEEDVNLEEKFNLLYDATRWTSTGNFGSMVYDPVSEHEYLEVYICDKCLKKKQKLAKEVRFVDKRTIVSCKEPEFKDLAQKR